MAMPPMIAERLISERRFSALRCASFLALRAAFCRARFSVGTERHPTCRATGTKFGMLARTGVVAGHVASCIVAAVALLVQKFGGTSVGDADRIRAVADHVARTRRAGDQVVVVVSAMGKTTDELVRLANEVSAAQRRASSTCSSPRARRISMSLLSMALADLGVEAASFTGSQAGIITDTDHTRAKILEVRADASARRSTTAECRWSPASRASRPSATSRPSDEGART